MRKRLIALSLATLALALGATGALAAPTPGLPNVVVTPVSFTLSSPPCADLPAGTTVWGSGTSRTRTYFLIDGNGRYHLNVHTTVRGTAVDNFGGTYTFNYHNTFRMSFTSLPGDGLITDHFTLVGNGPGALVHTFFSLRVLVYSLDPFLFDVVSGGVTGDPINCDPI